MGIFKALAYLLAAVVNLAPAIGMLSDSVLTQLYSVQIESAEIALLLRHRAVLFALVGGLLFAAAFIERLRTLAGIAGLVSMLSFVLLFLLTGADTPSLALVALIDWVVVLLLLPGFAAHLRSAGLRHN